MKVFKKNLPEGTKKAFGRYKGVKVKFVQKDTKKKNK